MNKQALTLPLLALLATVLAPTSLAAPIDPKLAFAFSENADWINFAPTHGGVDIAADGLSGFAWGENIGWIKLGSDAGPPYANSNASDWGVNNDGFGNLSGFAWSETAGWINFNSSNSSVLVDPADNSLIGFAWAENLGWIRFDSQFFGEMLIIFADGFEGNTVP